MDRFTYPSPMASGSIDHCQGSYASQEEEEQSNQHFRPAEMPNEAQVPTVHVPVPVPAQMYQSALPYSGPGPTCMDHLPIYVPVTQIPLSHLLPLSSTGPIDSSIPALDFNGYILYAATGVPEELIREPTGESIAEPGSILDEESGRTFVNHDTGRYFFPNDAVRQPLPSFCPSRARTEAGPADGHCLSSICAHIGRTGPSRSAAQAVQALSQQSAVPCPDRVAQEGA